MEAFLKAAIALALDMADTIPACEDDCNRVFSEPAWSNPSFNLTPTDDGEWQCTLGGTLEVEIGCVEPKEVRQGGEQRAV